MDASIYLSDQTSMYDVLRRLDNFEQAFKELEETALEYIDRSAERAEPFYLSVHYTAPHSPWTGHPQDIVDSYDDCAFDSCPQEDMHPWAVGHPLSEGCLGNRDMLKGYFAAVTAMDLEIGRLLDRLEKKGLREQTNVLPLRVRD